MPVVQQKITLGVIPENVGIEAPVKKIDDSAHIGDSGIALIHQLVNKMGFVWHERKIDAGIDGEIELRDPATGEVTNRLILVQSKARDRLFPGENDRSFHYPCRQADVDYWMSADAPVLLICSHPQTGEAWWMHVQSWFSDPAHRASGRIDFVKKTQRFDVDAAHRLLNLADPHGWAHVTVAEQRVEALTSNLLQVAVPDVLHCGPTDYRNHRKLIAEQRTTGAEVRGDFILRNGKIYTWLPPEATALKCALSGPTDAVATDEWAASSDPATKRALVQLLNFALRQDVAGDCEWHDGRKVVYFRATPDLAPRSIRGGSGRTRLVFNPKYKKQKPDEISYCQHAALEWQFLDIEGRWYCALIPTYHYTRDGYRDSLFLSEYLAGIKRLDRNPAVYQQTRMWAMYLKGEEGVLDPRDTTLGYGDLVTFSADHAIDDDAWLTDPRKANAAKGDGDEISGPDADEPTLFEVEP